MEHVETQQQYEGDLKRDKVIHSVILFIVGLAIVFSAFFVFMSVREQQAKQSHAPYVGDENEKGKTHPLPDFIVDKIESDELEVLKP